MVIKSSWRALDGAASTPVVEVWVGESDCGRIPTTCSGRGAAQGRVSRKGRVRTPKEKDKVLVKIVEFVVASGSRRAVSMGSGRIRVNYHVLAVIIPVISQS